MTIYFKYNVFIELQECTFEVRTNKAISRRKEAFLYNTQTNFVTRNRENRNKVVLAYAYYFISIRTKPIYKHVNISNLYFCYMYFIV